MLNDKQIEDYKAAKGKVGYHQVLLKLDMLTNNTRYVQCAIDEEFSLQRIDELVSGIGDFCQEISALCKQLTKRG